mmetsp:Transcript_3009/g.5115  ORF Transcript_3009/g.5115 Transcript_3009/m.5115 type:complete len:233 (-) Transcript_3009:115-813(-)
MERAAGLSTDESKSGSASPAPNAAKNLAFFSSRSPPPAPPPSSSSSGVGLTWHRPFPRMSTSVCTHVSGILSSVAVKYLADSSSSSSTGRTFTTGGSSAMASSSPSNSPASPSDVSAVISAMYARSRCASVPPGKGGKHATGEARSPVKYFRCARAAISWSGVTCGSFVHAFLWPDGSEATQYVHLFGPSSPSASKSFTPLPILKWIFSSVSSSASIGSGVVVCSVNAHATK